MHSSSTPLYRNFRLKYMKHLPMKILPRLYFFFLLNDTLSYAFCLAFLLVLHIQVFFSFVLLSKYFTSVFLISKTTAHTSKYHVCLMNSSWSCEVKKIYKPALLDKKVGDAKFTFFILWIRRTNYWSFHTHNEALSSTNLMHLSTS